MSSWAAHLRKLEAERKRHERESRKRQKELERRVKEEAKLSAQEQARLAVERFDNELEVLLSVHKEQSAPMDWQSFATALPPHQPPKVARHEIAALLTLAAGGATPSTDDRR